MKRIVFRLFPRAWWDRYGDEFLALLDDQPSGRRRWVDILRCLAAAHLDRPPKHPADGPARSHWIVPGAAVGLVAVLFVGAFVAAASPSALRKAISLLPTLTVIVPATALFVLIRMVKGSGDRRVRDALPRALTEVALLAVFGVIFAVTLSPRLGLFELPSTIELRPFQEVLFAPTDAARTEALAVLAGNAALFSVLGWLLALRYSTIGTKRAVTTLFLIAISLEIGQVLLGTGRPSDITEVIVRVAAGSLGYGLCRLTVRGDAPTSITTVA